MKVDQIGHQLLETENIILWFMLQIFSSMILHHLCNMNNKHMFPKNMHPSWVEWYISKSCTIFRKLHNIFDQVERYFDSGMIFLSWIYMISASCKFQCILYILPVNHTPCTVSFHEGMGTWNVTKNVVDYSTMEDRWETWVCVTYMSSHVRGSTARPLLKPQTIINGTVARLPAWVQGGMGSRVQSQAGANTGGFIPL